MNGALLIRQVRTLKTVLRAVANSDAAPASRAEASIEELSQVQITVTSQKTGLPGYHLDVCRLHGKDWQVP